MNAVRFYVLLLPLPVLMFGLCSCSDGHPSDIETAHRLSVVAGKMPVGTSREEVVRQLDRPYRTSTKTYDDDPSATCEEAYWELGSAHHVIYCDFRNQALVSVQESFERTEVLPHCTLHLDGSGKCWDKNDQAFEVPPARSGQ